MTEAHPDYLCVSLLGSGYAAIHMRWYADMGGYDVEQTGIGRYQTHAEAVIEARMWSVSDEIEYREYRGSLK